LFILLLYSLSLIPAVVFILQDHAAVETAIRNYDIGIDTFDDIEHHIKKLLCLNAVTPFEIWQKERGKAQANAPNRTPRMHSQEMRDYLLMRVFSIYFVRFSLVCSL
jgi:hypothetical protein